MITHIELGVFQMYYCMMHFFMGSHGFFPIGDITIRCLFFEVKISSKIQFFERSRETSLHKAAGSFYAEGWNF